MKAVHQGAIHDPGYLPQVVGIGEKVKMIADPEFACRSNGDPWIIDLSRVFLEVQLERLADDPIVRPACYLYEATSLEPGSVARLAVAQRLPAFVPLAACFFFQATVAERLLTCLSEEMGLPE